MHSSFRKRHGAEMSFSIRRCEFEIGAEMRPAVLKGFAGLAKVLDAIIKRNDPSNFFAHFPTGFAREQMGALGKRSSRDVAQNLPFGAGFADLARNFRSEHDSAFGAGFGAAIVLLVTCFGGQEDYFSFCWN